MSQTITKPDKSHFDEKALRQALQSKIPQGTTITSGTSTMNFEAVRDLLTNRPLRGIRQRDEDTDDIRAAREALADRERIPYDDVRRELGMG